jgi:actin-related protein
VPIYEGHIIPHGVRRLDIGGSDITEYLRKLFHHSGYPFSSNRNERDIVRDIKDLLAFVTCDHTGDMTRYDEEKQTLNEKMAAGNSSMEKDIVTCSAHFPLSHYDGRRLSAKDEPSPEKLVSSIHQRYELPGNDSIPLLFAVRIPSVALKCRVSDERIINRWSSDCGQCGTISMC